VPTVNFDLPDRRSAERFAELLDEGDGGPRHSRQPADEELAGLVTLGHRLSAAGPTAHVEPEFRVGLRAMLVAAAERDGIGVTATRVEAETGGGHAAVREPRRSLFGRAAGRRIRARGAIVIGVAAGALAVSGISAASENATPGDALYGVKRSTEKAQLAMAGSDVTRGQLSLDFARNRLSEATALGASTSFAGVLDDMDADTRQGVKLLTTSAVDRKDPSPLNTVDGFVVRQRTVLAPVTGKLTPANQERALESLALLDDVERRAEDLKVALVCDPISRTGVDTLGPKLQDCTAETDNADGAPSGQGEKQGSKPSPRHTAKNEKPAPAPSSSSRSPEVAGQVTAPAPSEPTAGPGATDSIPEPNTGYSGRGRLQDNGPVEDEPADEYPVDPGADAEQRDQLRGQGQYVG
jgi:hypothetical protein